MEKRTAQLDPLADVNVDRIRTAATRARLPSSAAGFHCDDCHFQLPMLLCFFGGTPLSVGVTKFYLTRHMMSQGKTAIATLRSLNGTWCR
jgi:hypothetical protein